MIIHIPVEEDVYQADLSKGIDLSLPISDQKKGPNCFGASRPDFSPMKGDGWIAKVDEGGSVNAMEVSFNPHGNGTHTECLGHISEGRRHLTEHMEDDFLWARVTTAKTKGGGPISPEDISGMDQLSFETAIIIRTLPNDEAKKEMDYTNTNPSYLSVEVVRALVEKGVKHLLIDLPSVDAEDDGGALSAHKAWWNWPTYEGREECTITEMVFVPDFVEDGRYVLNLQRASFDLDCAPSRPVIFAASKKEIRKTS